MRIIDWSSDVCSSDLRPSRCADGCSGVHAPIRPEVRSPSRSRVGAWDRIPGWDRVRDPVWAFWISERMRSEEHTSELQSLMRISYAVFCLKKKNNENNAYVGHNYHTE